MSVADVEIANRALEACNVDPITSLEDQTKPARLCRRLFPQLSGELMRELVPPFARRRAVLPALADAPAWGYQRQFQLPSDCLRLISTDPSYDWDCDENQVFRYSWRIEGTLVLTDQPAPLQVLYLANVGTDQYDPLFTAALVARMASELAMPLTNDARLLQLLETRALDRKQAARVANFGEAGDPVRRGASVIAARYR